jgi:hypothetical protein
MFNLPIKHANLTIALWIEPGIDIAVCINKLAF